jgi:hypothetical protein
MKSMLMKFLFILFFNIGFAQDSTYCNIIFYRTWNYYASAVKTKVFINNYALKVRNNSSISLEINSGPIIIKTKKDTIICNCEPNKIYYFRTGFEFSMVRAKDEIIETTEAYAKKEMLKISEKRIKKEKVIIIR